MTNREWYLNKLNAMTNEELADYIENEISPWCKNCCSNDCAQCVKAWFEKEHIELMPELKDGMFVEVKFADDSFYLGVVVNNKIIHQSGHWSPTKDSLDYITKVFDTCCFNLCDDSTCIWQKE